ncbi:MAG: amidohydrolase family protein [Myxococcales bacterium]|nr:amidohydrolase family protein [Myxococcales bacterium]
MAADLVLKNGLVVTGQRVLRGGVAVSDGRIAAVGADDELPRGARREIDVEGRVLFPGMFDPHTHLGSGDSRSYEAMSESFARDSKDCLIGGVTTIASTTVLGDDPLPVAYEKSVEAGAGRSHVDFKITCVVTREHHTGEVGAAIERGCTSLKFYTGYCGCLAEKMGMNPEGIPPAMFYRACENVVASGRRPLMMIHAEEPTVRFMLADRFAEQGRDSLLDWAAHSPDWAESVQVYQYGVITHELGLPLYVVHISRAHTIDFLVGLQAQGYDIIGETCVGFLSTTAEELHQRGVRLYGKIQPPIRHEADQQRLWRALREGVVTAIGTDTIPYTSKYKKDLPFWEARPGLNIQTLDSMSLLLTEGLHRGRIDWVTLARTTSEGPARHFGLYPQKGALEVGCDADVLVVDPHAELELGVERSLGGNDYSIWQGKKALGRVDMTFLGGELVAQDGQIVGEPRGKHVTRAPGSTR